MPRGKSELTYSPNHVQGVKRLFENIKYAPGLGTCCCILSVISGRKTFEFNFVFKVPFFSFHSQICTVPVFLGKLSVILFKIFLGKSRNQANLSTTRKLWYLFLRNFWVLKPRIHFWKENLAIDFLHII